PPSAAEDRAPSTADDQGSRQNTNPHRPPPTRRTAIVRRADPWSDRRACQRGIGIVHQARAPPRTRRARLLRGPDRGGRLRTPGDVLTDEPHAETHRQWTNDTSAPRTPTR